MTVQWKRSIMMPQKINSIKSIIFQKYSTVIKSHQESPRVIKHYKRVKASRASRLIQVERSNALINFSVLYQAFFKRFSSIPCFATSKRQALVYLHF